MKLFLGLVLWCLNSLAHTLPEIYQAFDQRSSNSWGFDNARKAQIMGNELGNLERDKNPELAARAYLLACKGSYFLGDYLPVNREEKKEIYKSGYLSCKNGIALIEESKGVPKIPELFDLLAQLYFMYTANFGRWFEDESRLDALRYWKTEVKPLLEILAGTMGREHIFGHGPLRALGWAWFSIPGGRSKALEYLKEAYEKSLHPELGVSIYPLNAAFFAQALIAKGESDKAKKILDSTLKIFSDSQNFTQLEEESFKVYGEHRIPEMLEEILLCREIREGMN